MEAEEIEGKIGMRVIEMRKIVGNRKDWRGWLEAIPMRYKGRRIMKKEIIWTFKCLGSFISKNSKIIIELQAKCITKYSGKKN